MRSQRECTPRRMLPCGSTRMSTPRRTRTSPPALREHKFGIDIAEAEAVYRRGSRLRNIAMDGVSCHIGSQLLDTRPMLEAAGKMLTFVERLCALGDPHPLTGFRRRARRRRTVPVRPAPEIGSFVVPAPPQDRGREPFHHARARPLDRRAEAGALLTRVLYRKCSRIETIRYRGCGDERPDSPVALPVPPRDPPGPENRAAGGAGGCRRSHLRIRGFPRPATARSPDVLPGDLLAVATAGAYGFAEASNYNSRPAPSGSPGRG